MGREIHDGAAMHSSIALLQERFRQLQRVKEMREERELLKMLSAADQPKHFNSNAKNPSMTHHHHEPTRLFFHPEMMTTIPSMSPPSPHNVSLSLWPTSHEEHNNISIFGTPVSTNSLRPKDCHSTRKLSLQASWKNIRDNWDSDSGGVDTTLHL